MTEKDPHGKHPNSPGAKLDAGKVRVGLVFKGFARALWKVCEVGTYGATKYTDNGWEHVIDGENRYDDAKGRHLLKGYVEDMDPDTNIEHLAHEAWNVLARLELQLRRKEMADKPITPMVGRVHGTASGDRTVRILAENDVCRNPYCECTVGYCAKGLLDARGLGWGKEKA